MIAQDAAHVPDPDEDEYDRRRLPGAYSQTMHHIRELRREREALRLRASPGDRFRAVQLSWFIRNNENYAARLLQRMEQLGATAAHALLTPLPALPAQLDLFA